MTPCLARPWMQEDGADYEQRRPKNARATPRQAPASIGGSLHRQSYGRKLVAYAARDALATIGSRTGSWCRLPIGAFAGARRMHQLAGPSTAIASAVLNGGSTAASADPIVARGHLRQAPPVETAPLCPPLYRLSAPAQGPVQI